VPPHNHHENTLKTTFHPNLQRTAAPTTTFRHHFWCHHRRHSFITCKPPQHHHHDTKLPTGSTTSLPRHKNTHRNHHHTTIACGRVNLKQIWKWIWNHNHITHQTQCDKIFGFYSLLCPQFVLPMNNKKQWKKFGKIKNSTTSVPNYKTLLRKNYIPFYKISLLFPTTLIISLHTRPYLLYIFFFNQQ